LRTAAQVTVALVNLLLNLWWIPVFGWIGAAWSSLASDGLLAVLNTLLLFLGWKRGVQAETSALAESEAYS
jgi:O-antigen/teichoic acid export membrane protein